MLAGALRPPCCLTASQLRTERLKTCLLGWAGLLLAPAEPNHSAAAAAAACCRWCAAYFPATLHATAPLPPEQGPYVFCYHPHGVLTFGVRRGRKGQRQQGGLPASVFACVRDVWGLPGGSSGCLLGITSSSQLCASLCRQPHAPLPLPLLCCQGWLSFATEALGFSRLFPGIDVRVLTLNINFRRVRSAWCLGVP